MTRAGIGEGPPISLTLINPQFNSLRLLGVTPMLVNAGQGRVGKGLAQSSWGAEQLAGSSTALGFRQGPPALGSGLTGSKERGVERNRGKGV